VQHQRSDSPFTYAPVHARQDSAAVAAGPSHSFPRGEGGMIRGTYNPMTYPPDSHYAKIDPSKLVALS
jgi:hypothetical protein